MKFYKQLAGSPVELAALETTVELMSRGLMSMQTTNWSNHVCALTSNDELAAFICWEVSDYHKAAHITLGGAVPKFRGQGYYKKLFHQLADYVRTNHPELTKITSGYHIDNHESAAMHAALNRKAVYVSTEFPL